MNDDRKPTVRRRSLLGGLMAASGSLILRSLATGLPAKILLSPLTASAEDFRPAKMLILSTSGQGDPINANVPGMYEVGPEEIFHPEDPLMDPTQLEWSGPSTVAAKPWAMLPRAVLDRTTFFHHATYTPVHGELERVQKMMDATEKSDMLVSLIAKELAPILGSVQSDPLSLGASGNELLSSGGRLLGNVAPTSVRQALGGVEGALEDLTALRDKHIDQIYALYRERGTPSQLKLLDAWARSRDQVRGIGQSLIARLDAIAADDEVNQVKAAAILAAMNIAPVITIHLPFGKDNHNDSGLATETADHLLSVPLLGTLVEELDQLKAEGSLMHDVLVGTLNVFGRTLKKGGLEGRDHHEDHHVMVLMGNGIRAGIVGGVVPNASGSDYIASSIDSTTGEKGGDVPFEETLAAAGKTLAYALGVSEERTNEMIEGGKIIKSVVDR